MLLSPVAVYLFLFLLFPFLVGLFIYIYIFVFEGRASRRWNLLVIRVTFCSGKHFMGSNSSVYSDMGNILNFT